MTERKYTLKYDLSDGQTGLAAGTFSVWDGDDGATYNSSGHYTIAWGITAAMSDGNIEYDYNEAEPFDPSNFSSLILAVGNYYKTYSDFNFTGDIGLKNVDVMTYIGKDGDDASGKNGTYITAVRVEAA